MYTPNIHKIPKCGKGKHYMHLLVMAGIRDWHKLALNPKFVRN